MLEQFDIPIKDWEETFQKKFVNFCKKSPILIKMQIKLEKGVKGVLITHVNTNSKYFFQFDYDMNVKDFIANIKALLVEKHYPRLVEDVYEKHEKSNSELAEDLEDGNSTVETLNKFAVQKAGTRLYRIDKVLPWKENVFLVLEKSNVPGDVLGTMYRYQYSKSIVLFLRSYRSNKFKSIEGASEEFFGNSFLISVIDKKD